MTYAINAKTAKGAATAIAKALNKEAVKRGGYPTATVEIVSPRYPEDTTRYYVHWEDGPYEWSLLAHWGNIFGEEETGSLAKAYSGPSTFTFKYSSHHAENRSDRRYWIECGSGSSLILGKENYKYNILGEDFKKKHRSQVRD